MKLRHLTACFYISLICAFSQSNCYDLFDDECDESFLYSDGSCEYNSFIPEELMGENYKSDQFQKRNFISFFSGYLPAQHTNQQIGNFGIDLINLGNYAIDKIGQEHNIWQFVTGIGFGYLYYIFGLSHHELGHGLMCRAFNMKYDFVAEKEKADLQKNRENFWTYYFKNITHFCRSGATAYSNNPPLSKYEDLMISTAGMNNEMYMAERIFDALHNGDLSDGYLTKAAYLYCKFSPMIYSSSTDQSSDAHYIEENYQHLGIDVKKSDIKTAYAVSAFGGMIISSIADYFVEKYSDDEESFVKNIKSPDLYSYVTSYGVSYKLVGGYRLNENLILKIGFEHVTYGNAKNEFSIGGVARFNHKFKPEISGMLYFGCAGLSIECAVSAFISKRLKLSVGLGSYTTRSLHGERHAKKMYNYLESDNRKIVNSEDMPKKITDFEKKNRKSNAIWVGISYAY